MPLPESWFGPSTASRVLLGHAYILDLPQDLLRYVQLPPRHVQIVGLQLRPARPTRSRHPQHRERLGVEQLLPHLRGVGVLRLHQLCPHVAHSHPLILRLSKDERPTLTTSAGRSGPRRSSPACGRSAPPGPAPPPPPPP